MYVFRGLDSTPLGGFVELFADAEKLTLGGRVYLKCNGQTVKTGQYQFLKRWRQSEWGTWGLPNESSGWFQDQYSMFGGNTANWSEGRGSVTKDPTNNKFLLPTSTTTMVIGDTSGFTYYTGITSSIVASTYHAPSETWVVGGSTAGSCYTFTDAAPTSWTSRSTGLTSSTITTFAVSPTTGTIIASNNRSSSEFTRSTDGGATWAPPSTPAAYMNGFVAMADGTFVGHHGTTAKYLYYSTDDGASWTTNSAIATSISSGIYEIAINNDGVVVIGDLSGNLYYASSYSASSATASVDTMPGTVRKIETDGVNFYAICNGTGSNSVVKISTDGGVSWTEEETEFFYYTSTGATKPAFEELLFDGIDTMVLASARGINFKGRVDRNRIAIPRRASSIPGVHYYIRVA